MDSKAVFRATPLRQVESSYGSSLRQPGCNPALKRFHIPWTYKAYRRTFPLHPTDSINRGNLTQVLSNGRHDRRHLHKVSCVHQAREVPQPSWTRLAWLPRGGVLSIETPILFCLSSFTVL